MQVKKKSKPRKFVVMLISAVPVPSVTEANFSVITLAI